MDKRPTPETDAAFLKIYANYLTPATIDLQEAEKFARNLERQRDEARDQLEKVTGQAGLLRLERDELLAALEAYRGQVANDGKYGYAEAAIAAVKGRKL